MYPFVPGCSTQKYFPYDEEENAEQYKKVQRQRALERKVRASKRECMMLKDGDPEAFQKASVKLKHNTQQLKTYCSSNDLTYMNERTTVMGYGRSEAGKVTAAYNRALKQEQANFMSKIGNKWNDSVVTKHTSDELEELNKYAADRGVKLYHRIPFSGDSELLKSEIDTIVDLRKEFNISDYVQVGWKRMGENDFGETSTNHQKIWINELALRSRKVTEKNLSADKFLATNTAEGIAAHEMGHIISSKIRNGKSGLDIYRETVYNVSGKRITDKEALSLLKENVSIYSAIVSQKSKGVKVCDEIIPEMLAINYTNSNKYSLEFVRLLKEACGI